MIKLYSTPVSSNAREALAVIHHLGLDAEIVETDVYAGEGQTPEFLALNPFGRVPTLVHGDLVL